MDREPLGDASADAAFDRDAHDLRPLDLEDALRPRRTRRGMVARLTLALLAAAGLAAVLLAQFASRAPAGAPVAALYLTSNVAPATVTLNGQVVAGAFPLALAPRRGPNVVLVRAVGFAPLSCAFTWPDLGATLAPPCLERVTTILGQRGAVGRRELVAPFDAPSLTADLRAAAWRAIAATADPMALIVPAGQYFATSADPATGAIATRLATTPLRGTVTIQPDLAHVTWADISQYLGGGAPPAGVRLWEIQGQSVARWTFTDDQGQPVGGATFPLSAAPAAFVVVMRGASVTAAAVTRFAPADPQCASGSVALNTLLIAARPVAFSLAPGANKGLVDGCSLLYEPAESNWPDTFTNDAATPRFLSRFGALLAANAAAHALVPALPQAPPAEIVAVEG